MQYGRYETDIRGVKGGRGASSRRDDGLDREPTYPQTARIEGGYTVLELPTRDEALRWAAKIAVACRCRQEVRVFQDDPET
ncbi:hypothetical protein [Cellulosimicrobium sp. NPDC055967]|uniref:hypothetical protein n=1 Tax=Cellulosimicrobium sp. NPDC055967 TaxID=3345670 RepID=UPI0035E26DB7